jgi:hypothetical protein
VKGISPPPTTGNHVESSTSSEVAINHGYTPTLILRTLTYNPLKRHFGDVHSWALGVCIEVGLTSVVTIPRISSEWKHRLQPGNRDAALQLSLHILRSFLYATHVRNCDEFFDFEMPRRLHGRPSKVSLRGKLVDQRPISVDAPQALNEFSKEIFSTISLFTE